MKTAFIGAYGYGNLGDELCLIDALAHFPHSDAYAFSVNGKWTHTCVPGLSGTFRTEGELTKLKPDRIVFGGGGIGTPQDFNSYLPWMARLKKAGSSCCVYNIGIASSISANYFDDEKRQLFRELEVFSVRDYKSAEIASQWSISRLPEVTNFPERNVSPDFAVADQVLDRNKKYLGISVIDTALMNSCLIADDKKVESLLARFPEHTIVPIVSTMHIDKKGESDHTGFQNFASRFLKGRKVEALELLNPAFWAANLTPMRLKGIIARLDILISERKHNCVHGIGAGVRTIGLHPIRDDSLPRTFVALSQHLVPGSVPVGLLAS
jgi:hypothetical protein